MVCRKQKRFRPTVRMGRGRVDGIGFRAGFGGRGYDVRNFHGAENRPIVCGRCLAGYTTVDSKTHDSMQHEQHRFKSATTEFEAEIAGRQ